MVLQDIPFIQIQPGDTPKPWLPITIINPHTDRKIKTYGLIDTGADECALPASYADRLGHNLQKGAIKEINTGNGTTMAYSHSVTIEIDGFRTEKVLIDFMPNLCVPLLGVKSFLSNFVLTVDYMKSTFSLHLHSAKS